MEAGFASTFTKIKGFIQQKITVFGVRSCCENVLSMLFLNVKVMMKREEGKREPNEVIKKSEISMQVKYPSRH